MSYIPLPWFATAARHGWPVVQGMFPIPLTYCSGQVQRCSASDLVWLHRAMAALVAMAQQPEELTDFMEPHKVLEGEVRDADVTAAPGGPASREKLHIRNACVLPLEAIEEALAAGAAADAAAQNSSSSN